MPGRIKPGWVVILGTAAVVVLLDQLTKGWIERNLPLYESIVPFPALDDTFTLTHFTNTGAAFGLFRDQNVLFVAIAAVVVLSVIVYSRYLPHDRLLVQIALGLQLGGAAGNMIDRVRLGHVTDFLYFRNLPIINQPWPAFNVADMAIVSGVILLAWFMLTYKEPEPASAAVDDQPST
ncbi:MAG TPA: signal peptidase II [Anaerolineae bacterium]|nr:signal peptidase II [Anaerolineae bacterium]